MRILRINLLHLQVPPVSKSPQYRYRMPPGMKVQIAFAIVVTIAALLILPTALSAKQSKVRDTRMPAADTGSAGSVATTMRTFSTKNLSAASFADWER